MNRDTINWILKKTEYRRYHQAAFRREVKMQAFFQLQLPGVQLPMQQGHERFLQAVQMRLQGLRKFTAIPAQALQGVGCSAPQRQRRNIAGIGLHSRRNRGGNAGLHMDHAGEVVLTVGIHELLQWSDFSGIQCSWMSPAVCTNIHGYFFPCVCLHRT